METLYDWLYIIGISSVWLGTLRQNFYMYKHKRAKDIKLSWAACWFFAELVTLPRILTSGYWVWWVNGIVGMLSVGAVLLAVILYGRDKHEKVP